MTDLQFSEENIHKIFGHEDALSEDPDRLKEYYFKSKTYEKIRADLPLRILVGHKGIGKSALFQVAESPFRDILFQHRQQGATWISERAVLHQWMGRE